MSKDEDGDASVGWETDSGESPSGSFLQISTNEDEFSPGTVASFQIRTRKETNNLCFMVSLDFFLLGKSFTSLYKTQIGVD